MAPAGRDLITLLSLTSSGNSEAFAELYEATHLKLFGIVLRIIRKRDLAEDILQEVYIKIWHRSGDYCPARGKPLTWMSVIARNRAIDEVRKRAPALADEPDAIEMVADETASPEDETEINDELRRLEACLSQLDATKRDAVLLAYLDGYTRVELATKLDQPVGTIKTWLKRSLASLKDCLKK